MFVVFLCFGGILYVITKYLLKYALMYTQLLRKMDSTMQKCPH